MDAHIKQSIYVGTQWVVFEPNDEKLWSNITTLIKSFLYTKWLEGGLKGVKPEDAYFVKCDAENNPPASIASGKVIIEVGYAKTTPAEFVIFRFSQKAST